MSYSKFLLILILIQIWKYSVNLEKSYIEKVYNYTGNFTLDNNTRNITPCVKPANMAQLFRDNSVHSHHYDWEVPIEKICDCLSGKLMFWSSLKFQIPYESYNNNELGFAMDAFQEDNKGCDFCICNVSNYCIKPLHPNFYVDFMPFCEETECYTYAVMYHPPFWTEIIYSPFVDENGVKYETEDATKVPLGKYTKYFKAAAFSCNGCNSIKNNSFFLELVRTTIITQPPNNNNKTFSWNFIIYIICTLLTLLLIAVIVFIIIKRKGSNQQKLSIAIIFTKQSHAKNSSLRLITIKELIVNMDDKNKIGAGEFGTVYADMLREAGIMAQLNHEHLLKLVGICLADGIKIVTPFRPLGSLHKFLKDKHSFLGPRELIMYCYQIASAMEYLSSNNIIHRDLAARNVLMKKYHHVEVTDFGLAAILREESQALQKLPFRWVPLECLREPTNMKLYCEASDVWSFGVTCWEILTFAQMPYCDLNFMFTNALKTLYGFLNDGGRLEQPKICSLELYQNLLMCWAANPLSRPTFTSLRETFEHHTKKPYMYITDARNIQETLDFTLDNEDKQLELIINVLGEDDYLEPREQDDIYNYLKNDSITQSDGGENLYIKPIDENDGKI